MKTVYYKHRYKHRSSIPSDFVLYATAHCTDNFYFLQSQHGLGSCIQYHTSALPKDKYLDQPLFLNEGSNYLWAEPLFQILNQSEKYMLLPAQMNVLTCTQSTQQNRGSAGPWVLIKQPETLLSHLGAFWDIKENRFDIF